VAVSGRTRSGKTTLVRGLSECLGWPAASFSTYVRSEARERGLEAQRRVLQDLGAELISELGWVGFAGAALAEHKLGPDEAPFAIEGVRHFGTLEGLRSCLAPVPVLLVHLSVSDEERNRRLAVESISSMEGQKWERHSTELEVLSDLPFAADLVIDADQAIEDVRNCALNWLRDAMAV
jgi:hypothetical protein